MPRDLATAVKLALLVLSLGMDTLAVAVALGISGMGKRNRLRVGAGFALFEGGMPLVGFAAGRLVSGALGEVASITGIVILFAVGAWMIHEGFAEAETDSQESASLSRSIESWWGLVLTSLSVSLDELAIGFSMGALGLPIGLTVVLIAAQAFLLTLIGTSIGNRIGEELAERAEMVAGIVLCGLALLLVGEKITGR